MRRYERKTTGKLLHLDTKKLTRLPPSPGHRVMHDRTRPMRTSTGRNCMNH